MAAPARPTLHSIISEESEGHDLGLDAAKESAEHPTDGGCGRRRRSAVVRRRTGEASDQPRLDDSKGVLDVGWVVDLPDRSVLRDGRPVPW